MLRCVRNSLVNGHLSGNKRSTRRLYSSSGNKSAQAEQLDEWLKTLNDVDRRKIGYFQNEVKDCIIQ